MKTNKTQTIDADALRARLAETPADLRGRIEAALRARDPDARVIVSGIPGDDVAVALGESVVTARVGSARALAPTGTEAAALAALAVAVGLNADGSDPRAEVERLRAESERRSELLDDVAHAHERDVLTIWAALGETHEPPENIAAVVGAVERLRALLAVTQSSLEAASSGRRVTACDDIERLQRERDALQDAAREYLAACDACEEAVDAFRANVAKGDADAARESMRAGAVTIQRGDAARARLAALAGGAS